MGHVVDIDVTNFEDDVVEASNQKPVLIDFFAQWCGPCQLLKPVLERLVHEYDFILAKVDIDQHPDLANAYGVEGVPDVRIVQAGEMRPGFVGVLPEPKLRDLLVSLGLQSDLDRGLDVLRQAIANNDIEAANAQFSTLINAYPEDQRLRLESAKFMLSQENIDDAESCLKDIPESDRTYGAQAKVLRGIIQLKRICQDVVLETELDQSFVQGAKLALQQDFETSLMMLLEVVTRDRNYRDDAARKAMLTVFSMLGDDHPLTRHYRKQLMLILY
ncbi:MAG: tetratricopeptide repeat protein [Cyanobacteria bacterium P01_E01_bin.6]